MPGLRRDSNNVLNRVRQLRPINTSLQPLRGLDGIYLPNSIDVSIALVSADFSP
jgi:hypothetical protein